MFSIAVNLFIFIAYIFILIIEFILMKIVDLRFSTPWLITTLAYIMFISYQVLARVIEALEKGKVRAMLYNIMDVVNGIPLINKNDRIIIQWDIIFKKLIDKKEYALYDSIIKIKTKTIDHYVNEYPSLLLNSSMDIIERNVKIDTKSLVNRDNENKGLEGKELDISEDIKNTLFIRYIDSNKVTFSNFDSSIYIDVLLNDEYEPQEYEKLCVEPNDRYDGFSLTAFYKNNKYTIVPRTMLIDKRIDKEKWLYRNIDKIMQSARNIAAEIKDYEIIIDEISLKGLLSDYVNNKENQVPEFYFKCIEENYLVFNGLIKEKETAVAYCLLETSPSGFEIRLIKYEILIDGVIKTSDEEKTVVIGNTYQPLITIMENMPIISNNIRLLISNQDIEELIVK